MNSQHRQIRDLSRRTFLGNSLAGISSLALASLPGIPEVNRLSETCPYPLPSLPHFPARAKRVVHLCMAGGPSQLESFDPKPALDKIDGQPFPASFIKCEQRGQLRGKELLARKSFVNFRKWGQAGIEISELFPHIGSIADELCVIRSMSTEQINHDAALSFMNTGSIIKSQPGIGSRILYGLDERSKDLPGYVVMTSGGPVTQSEPSLLWTVGMLPSRYQGIVFQSPRTPVQSICNSSGACQSTHRQIVSGMQRGNGALAEKDCDAEVKRQIAQNEMSLQLRAAAPELTDMAGESQQTLDMYGVKDLGDGSFASNCLLARRLLERDVRYVQLHHRGWDHHSDLKRNFTVSSTACDRPSAALVKDLKRLGMLEDTLVVWGGEFGRSPMAQGSGRDHHIDAFSIWMAGGGIKPGTVYGSTDELGYHCVENKVSVHDLHATMLHLFGIDHSRLTRSLQGPDVKLAGVAPSRVVTDLLV